MKKELLFSKLRKQTTATYDMPNMAINAIQYEDTYKKFVEMSIAAGCRIQPITPKDNLCEVVKKLYPEAKVFASHLQTFAPIVEKNPDMIASAQELNGTDVGIVEGKVGVAENACIWIPQTMKEKAVCFISEYLVIFLSKKAIVNNMHEAYRKIEMSHYGFGTFISGASKTADIEQALVMGAQAARGVTILISE